MIDFTCLKNNGEKLLTLFLSVSPPMRLNEITVTLGIAKSHCIAHLRELKEKGIIEKTVIHGVTHYRTINCTVPNGNHAVPNGNHLSSEKSAQLTNLEYLYCAS